MLQTVASHVCNSVHVVESPAPGVQASGIPLYFTWPPSLAARQNVDVMTRLLQGAAEGRSKKASAAGNQDIRKRLSLML